MVERLSLEGECELQSYARAAGIVGDRTRCAIRSAPLPAAVLAGVLAVGMALTGAASAQAVSNENVVGVQGAIRDQTFFVYTEAGELPNFVWEKTRVATEPFTITATDPTGVVQQTCVVPGTQPVGTGYCESTGLTSVAGVSSNTMDVSSANQLTASRA